ncbi:hypothetical protein [Microbacterium album]|uniref:Uncharacterized protein n=1 Tax=Microbacterium album TaxID=2053191 RepID=A0A917MK16_9MICO|nr:hypothetical protein [Microbacterium album]GGH34097.1 hypothetical protein GCM10010921_01530 [Microbacterium album]
MSWTPPTYDQWGETPANYEPERWDVVRDDGFVLIEGTSILDADTQVAWLNAHRPGGHTYESRLTEGNES